MFQALHAASLLPCSHQGRRLTIVKNSKLPEGAADGL